MNNSLNKNKWAVLLILFLITSILCGCAGNNGGTSNRGNDAAATDSGEDVPWEFYNERAEEYIITIADGNFDAAIDMFDATMAKAVDSSTLKSIWLQIVGQAGAFTDVHKIENIMADAYYICFVTTRHEKSGAILRIVFNKEGQVAGFFIDDYPALGAEESKSKVTQREGFTDYPVVIGEGTGYPLNAILSMPDDTTNPVPAVVIVHGSGSHDMDGTLFTNKPYRDIADYLAANDIAVIRYDKRGFVHGAKMVEQFGGSLTVQEESIEDAILATELVKADPRIDENKVFIIGHSLGGMLAPRIHVEGGNFAGLILLAGSPRFLLDISKDQNILHIKDTMEGNEREEAIKQMEESWDTQILNLMSLPDDEAKSTLFDTNVYVYYFKDLYENPIPAYIDRTTVPFLILQGTNDIQVTVEADYTAYQELLANRSNVTFKLYDGLNHLFMAGSADTTITQLMDEYAKEGKVDNQVLMDIVEWIKAQPS